MDTKLTLTVEQSVIEKAKLYAKERNHSLSDLIESYLKTLASGISSDGIELTDTVKSLKGSVKAPEKFDYNYKKILTEQLTQKYL